MEKIGHARILSNLAEVKRRPFEAETLQSVCPGPYCASIPDIYVWKCICCQDRLMVDGSFVFCSCGTAIISELEFKCPNDAHGQQFYSKANSTLKETNILLLGEAGVGKSTLIKLFKQITSFDTLEEAIGSSAGSPIQTSFSELDQSYQKGVTVSSDVARINEGQHNVNTSATKDAAVYRFTVGDTIVRFIDTPGVRDTREGEDERNKLLNVVGTISNLDHLHGICILLTPNQQHFTLWFRVWLREVLMYLDKTACNNITFCFTKSREYGYRPGEALITLRSLLEEIEAIRDTQVCLNNENVYCFDSEAYRYLLETKYTDLTPVDDKRRVCDLSWNKSKTEFVRLITHLQQVEPHKVKYTLRVNLAREMILRLESPRVKPIPRLQFERNNSKEAERLTVQDDVVNELEKASDKFSLFLKQNAMVPYNDCWGEYFDMFIQFENRKIGPGESSKILDCLKKSRVIFNKNQSILTRKLSKCKASEQHVPPTSIEAEVNKLRNLENWKSKATVMEFINQIETHLFPEIIENSSPSISMASELSKYRCFEEFQHDE